MLKSRNQSSCGPSHSSGGGLRALKYEMHNAASPLRQPSCATVSESTVMAEQLEFAAHADKSERKPWVIEGDNSRYSRKNALRKEPRKQLKCQHVLERNMEVSMLRLASFNSC